MCDIMWVVMSGVNVWYHMGGDVRCQCVVSCGCCCQVLMCGIMWVVVSGVNVWYHVGGGVRC